MRKEKMVMIDREKVVKGLTYCSKSKKSIDTEVCPMDCPYYNHSDYCIERLIDDALALLKEQESVVRCKDCVYGLETGTTSLRMCAKPYSGSPLYDINYYCADGERR